MAKWINVDERQGQIGFNDDDTFPFGVYMDEYKRMDDLTLPLHWHELLEYELVLSGTVEMRIDNETVILDTGDCAFVNSNTLHSGMQISTTEDAVVCAVCFTPHILTGSTHNTVYKKFFQPLLGKTIHGFKVNQESLFGSNIHDILYSLSQIDKDSFDYELLTISGVSELWLNTIKYINENMSEYAGKIKTFSQRNDIIKTLLIYVQENYSKDLSVSILAAYAHISQSECYRCFKYYTGKSPQEYIKDYRLSKAEHLLRTTDLSLIDIGLSCGFSGQSYFGEVFKKRYGVSPAKYRKTNT